MCYGFQGRWWAPHETPADYEYEDNEDQEADPDIERDRRRVREEGEE